MKSETMRQDKLGGVDQTHRPVVGSARKIVNMTNTGDEGWKTSGGSGDIDPNAVSTSIDSVESIFSFTQKGARHWLMYEARVTGASSLSLFAKNGRTIKSIQSGRHDSRGPWFKTQYFAYGEWCYILNGEDPPVRWNGKRLASVGFTQKPSAPSLVGPLDGEVLVDCISRNSPEPRFVLGGSGHYKRLLAYEEDRGVGDFPGVRSLEASLVVDDADDVPEWEDTPKIKNENAYPWHYGYVTTWINDMGMESSPSQMAFISGRNRPIMDLDKSYGKTSAQVWLANTFIPKYFKYNWAKRVMKAVIFRNNGRGRTLVQVDVPEAPSNVRAIRVYRTENLVPIGSDGQTGLTRTDEILRRQDVYLVKESHGASAFQFADGVPDQLLGVLLDQKDLGTFPRKAKRASLFMNRMFTFGELDYPNRLSYSAATFIEQFPKKNKITVGNSSSGKIMALHATANSLYVLKERGIYVLHQEGEYFRVNTITEESGCSSPNAIFNIPHIGTLFLGERGIYLLGGTSQKEVWEGSVTSSYSIDKVSGPIDRWWEERVLKGALLRAHGVVNTSSEEVWFQLPVDDGYASNYGLVYHYKTGAFSFREGFKVNSFTRTNDHRDLIFMGMYDNNPADTGLAINHYSWAFDPPVISSYACSPLDFGSVYDRTDIMYFTPFLLAYGDRQLTLNYREDRKQVQVLSSPETRGSVNTEDPLDKWGSAVFGSAGIWQSYEATQVRFPVAAHSLEWDFEIQGTKLNLIGYDLGVAPSQSATSIMRLDSSIGSERP